MGELAALGQGDRRNTRTIVIAVLFATVSSVSLAAVGLRSLRARPLPDLGALPDFTLTDQRGQPFAAGALDGKVWVFDFFFSRCPSVCPRLTAEMQRVDRWVAEHADVSARAGLASITVDPKGDTPERLAAFGAEHRIDPTRWHLLTGASTAVEDVVVRGFKIGLGEPTPDVTTGRFDILHGTRLVLVDAHRHIRGYYDGDAGGVERIEADMKRLLEAR